ncbi:MAG: sulfatase-like hydrolase/transferase [candidate division KSB1 bacterium]|nr:sulfatase-like hydrolase/transferase [candidate division KSB1 bacterium]
MKRRRFLKAAGTTALAAAILPGCNSKPAGAEKPNFLLLVADDMGWDDLSLHGNSIIATPNLDRFAQESVQFKHFYVNPVCAPTRASLLTGRHFLRTGVSHVHGGKDFLALNEVTVADVLRDNGYRTGMWGKWHSGKTEGYFPWQRGFEEAYMAGLYQHRDNQGFYNGEPKQHKGWITDVLVDYAIDFMQRHQDEPFFAYVPFLSCHAPLNARDDRVKRYMEKGISRALAVVYAMVERMDEQVRRLLDELDALGLSENTVVIFFSDNGPAVLNADLTHADRETRYVNDLRGHKGNIWENGVRSPFFVRWNNHLKPATVERLVDCCDLYPTLLELAGVRNPHNRTLDGRSIADYLYAETEKLKPKYSYNYAQPAWVPTDEPWTPRGVKQEYRPVTPEEKKNLKLRDQIISIQKENYKLMMNPGRIDEMPECAEQGLCLYDVGEDAMQQNDIKAEHPKRVNKLTGRLERWWQSVLRERNSFKMPVFLIGHNGKKHSTVLAYAPYDISKDVKCAFDHTYNWRQAGDFAVYHIRVQIPGSYRVSLDYEAAEVKGSMVQVAVNGARIEGVIDDPNRAVLGSMDLESGEQFLTLTISNASADVPVFDKLYTINLIKT